MRLSALPLRVWLLAALAAVLAAGAVVGLVVTGGGDASGRETGAVADPGGPAVRILLRDHADALLRRDRTAFTAGLDDAPAAAQFRAAQLAAFDHTDGVPFASFALAYERTVVDDTSVAAARARLGDDTAAIVRAELIYAFAGVDARPAEHTVYLTVVRRGSDWELAGDTDLAAAGGTSWRGPWDFGPLVVARGATCVVLAHPASDDVTDVAEAQTLVRGLAADVDAGTRAVTAVWGTDWPQRVAVVVAATQPELDAIAGEGFPIDGVAALAVAEPTTSVTEGPDVAAGQRIVVSGPEVPRLTATGRSVLLRHELTHVATRGVTVEGMPTWVVEGFADYVANLGGTQPPRTVAAELAAQVARAGVPTALPADASFDPLADASTGSGTAATASAAAAYEQAWYALRTVASLGGPTAPAAFYRAVAAGAARGTAPAAVLAAALRATTRTDTSAFTARWRALIGAELT
ncbi:hypothetical protein ACXR2U_20210 [Jatrophihabitans sp. YIM 134969]